MICTLWFRKKKQEAAERGAAEAARGGALQQVGEDALLGMELPPGVRSLGVVEDSSTNTLLASISTALHLGHGPVKGQVGGGV